MIDFERIKRLIGEDRFLISRHARVRMFQRNVSTDEIKEIILNGEIIERYDDDKPCPSALILGFVRETPYHVVVAECEDHVRIITVYIPDKSKWVDYRVKEERCMKPNTCSLCGGILREGKTELLIRINDQVVVIKNVPAYVCEDCGEAYFTPDTSRKIDRIMKEFHEDKIAKRPITAFEIEL